MSVFRVEKNKNFTVMANYHLNDQELSLKAKGLLSFMLSLPEDWDYSIKGLSARNKEGVKSIRAILRELEERGYLVRKRIQSGNGHFDYEYYIYEKPQPHTLLPHTLQGHTVEGHALDGTQLNTQELNTQQQSTHSENNKLNRGKFQKPTIEEVSDYIQEKQLNVNPDQFFNYYESNGWMVGRNPMKNWKAALRTWHAKSKTPQQQAQTQAIARLNPDDQPYEPEPTEDIRPWQEFFDEWQEILGMRPAQTVGNVRAAKQLKAETDPEMLTALMVALAMRGQTGYLTREIKNIITPADLYANRERVWNFYQENRETWKWQQSMRRGAGLIN